MRMAPHQIATLRLRNEWLEHRLQDREEVISALADKVAESDLLARRAERYRSQRDEARRLFNRMDAAISHHRREAERLFVDVHDEALYTARDRVLRASADHTG